MCSELSSSILSGVHELLQENKKLELIINSFNSSLRVHKPWRTFKQVCSRVNKLCRLELGTLTTVDASSPHCVVMSALHSLHALHHTLTAVTTYCHLTVTANLTLLGIGHLVAKIIIQIAAVSRIWCMCRSLLRKVSSSYSLLLRVAAPDEAQMLHAQLATALHTHARTQLNN